MTLTLKPPSVGVAVSGTGPYAIGFPYQANTIGVAIVKAGIRTVLVPGTDFTVAPVSGNSGNITLSAAAAAAYAGGTLFPLRTTPATQDWAGVQGEREAGLEDQLDRLTLLLQEILEAGLNSFRIDTPVAPLAKVPGGVLGFALDGTPTVLSGIIPQAVAAWLAPLFLSANPAAFRSGIGAIAGSEVYALANLTTTVTAVTSIPALPSGRYFAAAGAAGAPNASEDNFYSFDGYTDDGVIEATGRSTGTRWRAVVTDGVIGTWLRYELYLGAVTNIDTLGTLAGTFTFTQAATGAIAGIGSYTAAGFHIGTSAGRTQWATILTGTHAGRRYWRTDDGSGWSAASWKPDPVRLAGSAANIAQLDLTLPAGMTRARLTAEITPATAGANMAARLSADGGTTFIATGTYHSFAHQLSNGSSAVGNLDNVTNGTSLKLSGAIDPAVVTLLTLDLTCDTTALVKADATYKGNGIADRVRALAQGMQPTAAINAIRLFASTGNFTVRFLWEALP